MVTSLLILMLWYLAMSKCATLVIEDTEKGDGSHKPASFPLIMCLLTVLWVCLRLCFGPGEDQFRCV